MRKPIAALSTIVLLVLGGRLRAAAPSHDMYICAETASGYVVGSKLARPNGVFKREAGGHFEHLGANYAGLFAVAFDPRDSRVFYTAMINGCARTLDGGATWRIGTSWDMTEPKDVEVDPNSPDHVYLALPDGIAVSTDRGETWARCEHGLPDRGKYTQVLAIDRTRAGRLLAGCESGIYLTEDGARSWRRVAPASATVDDIRQSPGDPQSWLAVTQADGAFSSRDGGRTWQKVRSLPCDGDLYNADYDSRDARRCAVCGWDCGVMTTEDGGRTWTTRNAGLPVGRSVFRVAVDPDDGLLYANVYDDGLYASADFGRTWRVADFERCRIFSFTFRPAPAGAPAPTVASAGLSPVPSFEGPAPSPAVVADPAARRAAYCARIDETLAWKARTGLEAGADTLDVGAIMALLSRREHADLCSARVIELMKAPDSGPFWMFPIVEIAYLGRGQLSPAAQAAIRGAWGSVIQMRGDTENHWAMYYSSLYLMSQLYPREPGTSWYTGKSSEANLAEARDYLLQWMDLTTTIGQGEFNPAAYIAEYAIPMEMLASWAKDPAMRVRAQMTLDWLFADLAAHTLNGELGAPNARTTDLAVTEHWNANASFFSWLLFGNIPPNPSYAEGFGVYFAGVARNYRLPEVIYRIAVDRGADYSQRDLKRTRRRWRNSELFMPPVYKTTYMRRDYTVGSYQGGLADPIQTHVWDVMWAVPDPRGVHNAIFSLHPSVSSYEMQTYFAEMPDPMVKNVIHESKPTYGSPDKWLGGSRFERVFQDRDTVVALYDIAPGSTYPHINGFFSKDLTDLTEDKSGWIFARGGRTYLAYRPLASYAWVPTVAGDRWLYSPHLKNGTIVQAASVSEFSDLAAFRRAVDALPLRFSLEPVPTVSMRTLRGRNIVVTYGKAPVVDGVALDYSKWKLFQGPYLNAEKGSKRLVITHGDLRRVLDFNTLTISDSP